jgi:hypothetical protein
MTVKELINKLKEFPEDVEVYFEELVITPTKVSGVDYIDSQKK